MTNALHHQFIAGALYRVVNDGCYLCHLRPIALGTDTLWRRDLRIVDVISCGGLGFSAGGGVPVMGWLSADGGRLVNDCAFQPNNGRRGEAFRRGRLVEIEFR